MRKDTYRRREEPNIHLPIEVYYFLIIIHVNGDDKLLRAMDLDNPLEKKKLY